jgi:hypothetical protein
LTESDRNGQFDEIRVITLPPPQTAAVNRLLREEQGWRLIDARVTERSRLEGTSEMRETLIVYVLGHIGSDPQGGSGEHADHSG